MKSNSCGKSRGVGAPSSSAPEAANLAPAAQHPQAQTVESVSALCSHVGSAGRRCHMLVRSLDSDLCAYHTQRRMQAQRGSETAAAELLSFGSEFHDAESVNRFLGILVKQVALKRIPRRDAVTLAYLCQLLLNSLGAGCREERLRLELERLQGLQAQKRPPQIIWDIPGPPYEPPDPLAAALAEKTRKDQGSRK